jgi:predicted lipoprotein with Yx(FWY)xxD motif
MKTLHLAAALSALALAACAGAPAKMEGGVLTGATGMTLYTFDKDPAGKSVCNGPCAVNWPPLMATEMAKPVGEYTVITRDDGKKQYAYKGKPLYYWIKDQKPGDKTGDGFLNGAWHVAKE